MRIRLFVAGVLTLHLAACSGRPLPPATATELDAGADAGSDGDLDRPPLPGSVDWGIAVGPEAATGGSTTVSALVPLADGSVIVSGGFTGTVSFASDVSKTASSPRGAFVARYRSDQRLVWVTTLSAPDGDVQIADLAPLDSSEIAIAGWFQATLTIGDDADPGKPTALTSAGGLDLFVARVAADGSVRWAKRAGGVGDDIARGVATRIDLSSATGSGGTETIALTGAIGPGALFGAGESGASQAPAGSGPIFVASFDGTDGTFSWAAFPGGQVPGQGYAVAIDGSGTVGVTGYVNGPAPFGVGPDGAAVTIDPAVGRAFVAAWTAQGQLAWALPLAGAMGEGDALVDAPGGGFAATGLFEGKASFGPGGAGPGPTLTSDTSSQPGTYLAMVGPAGALGAVRRLAGSGVRPWRLHRDGGGELFLAASFGGMVLLDPDGPHPSHLTSRGNDDAAFIHLAADGSLHAVTTGGGLGDDEAADFAPAPDGTSWAGGQYAGPATFGAHAVTLDSGTDGAGFLLHVDP
jgi:hypothetical protein